MEHSEEATLARERPQASAALICLAAWAIPGSGHILLGRFGSGLLLGGTIYLLFILGLSMDGALFAPAADLFRLLKFAADLGNGLIYFIAMALGYGTGNISSFTYDYGNVYIYTAGLMNMLIMVDAYDIATDRK